MTLRASPSPCIAGSCSAIVPRTLRHALAPVPLRGACPCRAPGDPSARSARGDRGRPADGRGHAQGAGDRRAGCCRGPAVRTGRAGRYVLAGRRRRGRPGGAASDVVGVEVRDRGRRVRNRPGAGRDRPVGRDGGSCGLRASRRVVRSGRPGGRCSPGPWPVPGRFRAPRQSGLRRLAGGAGHPCRTVRRGSARSAGCRTARGAAMSPGPWRRRAVGSSSIRSTSSGSGGSSSCSPRPAIEAGRSGSTASWSPSSTASSGSRRSTRRPNCTTRSARTGLHPTRRSDAAAPALASAPAPDGEPAPLPFVGRDRELETPGLGLACVGPRRAARPPRRRGRHRQDPSGRGPGRDRADRGRDRARGARLPGRGRDRLRPDRGSPASGPRDSRSARRLAALNETTRADLGRLVDLPAPLRPPTAAASIAPDAPGARVRLLEAIADGLDGSHHREAPGSSGSTISTSPMRRRARPWRISLAGSVAARSCCS